MHLLPLVAATYFMVSGGPYGIEEILGGAGFATGILILLLLPLFWSLPTALMIGELASALPAEGGFYTWVRRAMGPFWGYQEGWLSLAASVFDMAIYPAICVQYLGQAFPALSSGPWSYGCKLAVVALCCLWNLRGAPSVGDGSMGFFALLLAPFGVLIALGFWTGWTLHPAVQWGRPASASALSTAVLVALWNYMGWDNASTVAQEVENPQKNYPRAMVCATLLVTLSYVLPLVAVAVAGCPIENLTTGEWASVATRLGGHWLGLAVVLGGAATGFAMFNALVMSYTRLPMAMAEDGMLPHALTRRNRRGVPWVSVLACGLGWALALHLPFDRLITIDLILYGSALMLEFVALVALRLREPRLQRPFRAGNLAFACLLGVGPAVLIGYALWVSRNDRLLGRFPAPLFALLVALFGPVFYMLTFLTRRTAKQGATNTAAEPPEIIEFSE